MDDLDTFIANSVKTAKDSFIKDPSLDGTMLVFGETDIPEHNAMWAICFEDEDQKSLLLTGLSIAMQARKVKRYAVMTMAWMSEAKVKPGRKEIDYIPPSQSPDRKEGLLVTVVSVDGQLKVCVFDVFRGVAKKITGFGEMADMDGVKVFGRLGALLEHDPRIPDIIREIADEKMAHFLVHGNPLSISDVTAKTPRPH